MSILAEATGSSTATALQYIGYLIGGIILAIGSGKVGSTIQKRRINGADESHHAKAPAWCDTKHEELEKRLDERNEHQSKSLARIEKGISDVHNRIDGLYTRGDHTG